MGQLDQTDHSRIRQRIFDALAVAERTDPNGPTAQTLRLVRCALSDRDVSARGRGECAGCDEAEIQKLLEMMLAQREISAREFDEAGRIADAEREREEIELIEAFLPQPLTGEALKAAVKAVVSELDARKLKDVGRCMTALRERFPGRIECGPAGKAVRDALHNAD